MAHGTFRNKISEFIKDGKVILDYKSSCAFYTIPGYQFGQINSMTRYHTEIHGHPFYRYLQDLPLGKQSIHDVRLKFEIAGIYKLFSTNPCSHINSRSGDIVIPAWHNDNIIIKVFIHRTDAISVILGCSINPIPLDIEGIINFNTILGRIEERIRVLSKEKNPIPSYRKWIITMWHFGRDSLLGYGGEKFWITTEKD